MSRVTIDDYILTSTANAIREQLGTSGMISPLKFPSLIQSIECGEDNGLFYQEYSSVNNININSGTAYIDLDVDDVEWLIFFPLADSVPGNYSCTGGIYIPNVFGLVERSSYGASTLSTIGCKYGTDIQVSDGMLSLHKGQNCTIFAGFKYGIIGKEKK